VVRESFDPIAIPSALAFLIEIPDVVMEQKALHTVKQRAEGQPVSAFTTFYEITVWLATFAIGVIAGVFYLKHSNWQTFLAVAVAALLVLLAITFLFPPLWLRGVLVSALLVGLGCSLWQRADARAQSSASTLENANRLRRSLQIPDAEHE
jgi:hypothetical protein